MTSLLALLCLGLGLSTRTPVKAGTVPRPILWAEPGSVVLRNTPVTLWCQGDSGAQEFHLVKTGISPSWGTQLPLELGDKAKFFIPYITEAHAGTYKCSYLSPTGWSKHSDPLELVVVTGVNSKLSLSAFPSPVVASGETVTLQCNSWLEFDTFVLTQEGNPESHWKRGSRLPSGQHQALFHIGVGSFRHSLSFQCYGLFSQEPQRWSHPSDLLQILVSGKAHPGASIRPSLLSPQGEIVALRQTPTLQCHSKDAYDIFVLYKEDSQDIRQHPGHHPQAGISQANFTLGPVSASHGGRYRCIGRNGFTSLWSEPSDPMDIQVEGQLPYIPTLSVEPGPSVSPGDKVTLLCQSRGSTDTFLMAKEGSADPPLRVKVVKTEEITQVQFSFHPVTSAHNGTYKCYSSNSITPYWLSKPSAPLKLQVSGLSGDSKTMSMADVGTQGVQLALVLKPGPSDTSACVLHSCCRPSAHIQKDSPGDNYREDGWLRVWDLGQEVTITHKKSEEGVQLNPKAEAPEAPLEVTYAQLKYLDTAQETTAPPPSLSGEPPEEPSVYAALAFH
ncbi:leukocyte immunoglobulin-like receptor subfamily A member 3 [Suncus etruscus]|uniref:leukocyte immunoglobulin-like receptor subfamily A member 3 n=1 Tax=Suncus etruscus TaxID=109475 RepID=UPI002110015A|nr:leukocyte immunoglobulin-like receptor subfamily A member 3 [Suncus etruscus]